MRSTKLVVHDIAYRLLVNGSVLQKIHQLVDTEGDFDSASLSITPNLRATCTSFHLSNMPFFKVISINGLRNSGFICRTRSAMSSALSAFGS